ncbi:unnamed protein product [Adineta steineri]|uniref:NADH dehydrogenase [ubiquinone] flavoprotein 3, mitochondrial n=1 Tax=Adineta steineri TaxID=433720 RepID=A0A819C2U6_9BILA|nr:unnamed protein product [Adineta steineri]CAF3813728.1 unnamed protein product [Adineta steineri]
MISNQLLRSSSTMSLVCYRQFVPLLTRFGSTLSKETPSKQDKSTNKDKSGKSWVEYKADDMYDYTTFSYYDLEASMTKYRLPQPSPYTPFKADSATQKK